MMRAGTVSPWNMRNSPSFEITYIASFPMHQKSPWYHSGWHCWYQPLDRQPINNHISAYIIQNIGHLLTSPLLSDICLSTLWSPKISLTENMSVTLFGYALEENLPFLSTPGTLWWIYMTYLVSNMHRYACHGPLTLAWLGSSSVNERRLTSGKFTAPNVTPWFTYLTRASATRLYN
jgi:hypothetical protein